MKYRKSWWGYTFSAMIDDRGWNADREHARWCKRRRCYHLHLWELNSRDGTTRVAIRWRFWPPVITLRVP